MREKYIELMAKALTAYSDEHIISYFERVKSNGLTEHGFPRLCANIGILIAHGIRRDLLPLFLEMMEFCCSTIPNVKAANDFSVKEIIFCMLELDRAHIVSDETLSRWRDYFKTIDPAKCYNRFARKPEDRERNWALFTGVSEYMRTAAGLADTMDFVELQIASQLKWIDENGMYRDADIHPPMVYDLVPRGLFAVMHHLGYRGKYYELVESYLKKAGLLTLKMQSVTGELPYGGRSNQFIHNEAHLALVCEYEANRYAREGNTELAGKFKAAVARAVADADGWLSKNPIRHVKNRFETETSYGCESYAYFDKYMITAASFFYAAYLICDDSIAASSADDTPSVCRIGDDFHKLFANTAEYSLEFDIDADPHYDASGLGRLHRKGAPSAICMAAPCPAEPAYTVDIEKPLPLSICSGIKADGDWRFAADGAIRYEVVSMHADEKSAEVELGCKFGDSGAVREKYTVTDDGVSIDLYGDGEIALMLPAFCFDGEVYTEISGSTAELTVRYNDWECRYITDGVIHDSGRQSCNRNGHYRAFFASANEHISVCVKIVKL